MYIITRLKKKKANNKKAAKVSQEINAKNTEKADKDAKKLDGLTPVIWLISARERIKDLKETIGVMRAKVILVILLFQ
ncbi:MAG: hypothetical protein HC852_13070 [Acaryochloridaceae cyanobacterium RU_4_10]|nr:hypothetical protein [Acaryochloridaceae cyanobacterium RU_4_10]